MGLKPFVAVALKRVNFESVRVNLEPIKFGIYPLKSLFFKGFTATCPS